MNKQFIDLHQFFQKSIVVILTIFATTYLYANDAQIIIHKQGYDTAGTPIRLAIHRFGILDSRFDIVNTPTIEGNYLRFAIKNIEKPEFFSISYVGIPILLSRTIFIISPMDSVVITIDNNSVSFSGRGFTPYECAYRLMLEDSLVEPLTNVANSTAIYNTKKHILSQYEYRMNHELYGLILNTLNISYNMSLYTVLKKMHEEKFNEEKIAIYEKLIDIDLSKISYLQPEYFMQKFRYHKSGKISIGEIFQSINTNYSGVVKEQLIAYLVSNELRSQTIDKYYLDVISTFQSEELKDYCLMILNGRIAGTQAPNFNNLIGMDGRFYSLSDFHGKVVIMDFWFTGCGACTLIPPILGPMAEKFRGRDDIVFLSISIDESMNQWKKSVAEGIYTFNNSIKLYTNEEGSNHSILKDYNIKSYPQIVGISKFGKILSIPQNPRSDKGKSLEKSILLELNNGSSIN